MLDTRPAEEAVMPAEQVDLYQLAVRLRTLLDVTDCQSVLLTHANGTVIQATRDGELKILADETITFDPDEARYGAGPFMPLLEADAVDVEVPGYGR